MTPNTDELAQDVQVFVETNYIEHQSNEAERQYVFSYTITIDNNGPETLQLLSRYWLISDASGDENTVAGEGVIGQQPYIRSKKSFSYTSGCILKSPLGTMQGHYQMQSSTGALRQVDIPVFRLSKPNIIN